MARMLQEMLSKLYSRKQENSKRAGLDNIRHLCDLLKNPEKQFSHVHIAGTNGKGSVASKISRGLYLNGKKTGLYTSPHIECYNERIQINGTLIADDELFRLLSQIFEIAELHSIPATFFEITTILCFLYFAEQNVEIAVIEAGIGGRLDPTNIILPKLTVITSIGFDHCQVLGNTIQAITIEKAGIIKQYIPVVVGPNVPCGIIEEIAHIMLAPCYLVTGKFEWYDDENSAVAAKALKLLKVPPNVIKEAIQARPPCRLEVYCDKGPPAVVLDVAHNSDGLRCLFMAVRKFYPQYKLRVLCGMSQDKDIKKALAILKEYGHVFHFTRASIERACLPIDLKALLIGMGATKERIYANESIEKSFKQALLDAEAYNEVLVVCGTFFIMADVRKVLIPGPSITLL